MGRNELEIKSGDRYNKLIIVQEVEKMSKRRAFLCKCDCGNTHTVLLQSLRSGKCKSCGSCNVKKEIKESNMKIKELTLLEVLKMLYENNGKVELYVRDNDTQEWTLKEITGVNIDTRYRSGYRFLGIVGWVHTGVEVPATKRPMTNFEMLNAVKNGAIIRDKKMQGVYSCFSYMLGTKVIDAENYLICYNLQEAKTEDDLIWKECKIEENE